KIMKNVLIIVIILLVVIVVGYFIFTSDKSQDLPEQDGQSASEPDRQKIREQGEPEDKTVLGQGFSVKVPKGWVEQTAPMGVSLMAVDMLSVVNDERARQINFHPYYTVSLDSLQDLELQGYVEILKQGINQVTPGIVFQNENNLEINANKAYAMEGEVIQNEIEFKLLIVLVKGKTKDVWVVSFNTTKADWDKNAPQFTEIANSFLIR
ncbi:hypothetical protein KKG58_04950, partial [Patescibacteria group bacterium]|nr:hypothetical protein [Patescibacteria group bacterium]